MATDLSNGAPLQAELEAVYGWYLALCAAVPDEAGLGGTLVYAGELDAEGCRLVRAANIAGAASLSVTGDAGRQRAAIREGVIDFLVTSLDEALRILKNEIRKKNPVAVGISAAPSQVMAEMRERGVVPDLVRTGSGDELVGFLEQGSRIIEAAAASARLVVVASPPAGFEERSLGAISKSEHAARRWVRLASRYLGPAARRVRSVPVDAAAALGLEIVDE